MKRTLSSVILPFILFSLPPALAADHGNPPPSSSSESALPPALPPEELVSLLCPNAKKNNAPPGSLPESAAQSKQQDSQEAAERLADEMETFVSCELFPFLSDPDAYDRRAPNDQGCGHVPSGPLAFSDKARRKFLEYFNVEPCHGDILAATTGGLRDAWWNRGDLAGYFAALQPMLDERTKAHARSAGALREQIRDFEKRARQALPGGRLEGPPPPAGGADNPPPPIADALACFEKKIAADAPAFNGRASLAFYALLQGTHRVDPDALEATLKRAQGKCARPPEKSGACLLTLLGYAHPERIAAIYDRHHIAVLGYRETADLDFFDSVFKRHPALYDTKSGKHAVRALLAPDSIDLPTNAWDESSRTIRFWSREHLAHREAQAAARRKSGELSESALDGVKQEIESLRRDREYILLHETTHSVDTRFLQTDEPGVRGQDWNAISWGRAAEGPWRHEPFTCEGVKFPDGKTPVAPHATPADVLAQKHGFVTYYAATNPAEDFAESGALFFTNPERLRALAPRKYAFLKKIFEEREKR